LNRQYKRAPVIDAITRLGKGNGSEGGGTAGKVVKDGRQCGEKVRGEDLVL